MKKENVQKNHTNDPFFTLYNLKSKINCKIIQLFYSSVDALKRIHFIKRTEGIKKCTHCNMLNFHVKNFEHWTVFERGVCRINL